MYSHLKILITSFGNNISDRNTHVTNYSLAKMRIFSSVSKDLDNKTACKAILLYFISPDEDRQDTTLQDKRTWVNSAPQSRDSIE